MNQGKPQIMIMIYDENPMALKEVIAGIEEEQVLWDMNQTAEYKSAKLLAEEGAKTSSLEVGVGIYRNTVVLQCRELIGREPLFETDYDYRRIGSNAGRYVKRNPFILLK